MEIPLPLNLIPVIVLCGFTVVVAIIIYAYTSARQKLPIPGPIIGDCNFHLKGSGEVISGLTVVARRVVDPRWMAWLQDQLSENARRIMQNLNYYAVKAGGRNTLVISTHPIESQEYSDAIGTPKYIFPFGFRYERNVYGYGIHIDRPIEGLDTVWDDVVFIIPDNLVAGVSSYEEARNIEAIAELGRVLEAAARAREEAEIAKMQSRISRTHLETAREALVRATDMAQWERTRAAVSTPFGSEEEILEAGWKMPKWTWYHVLSIIFSAAIGYYHLPKYIHVTQPQGALLGAAACTLFWIWWENRGR